MTPPRRSRMLIVDDSAVMRSLLRAVVSADTQLEVAGTAADGASAIESVPLLWPDLILLDVEMPVMDGLATLRELHRRWSRIPVIMCSSLTQRGARVTIEALACGAADYVTKPSGASDRETALRMLANELIPKIRALAKQSPPASMSQPAPGEVEPLTSTPTPLASDSRRASAEPHATPRVSVPAAIAIGVSTGGPAALDVLLPLLPADFPLPVLVVQHMPELFTRLLAERLNSRCNLRVCEASQGEPVCAGNVYIARGNWHMETMAAVSREKPVTLLLHQGAPESHCRPAVDVLFRSVAKVYGAGVLAVVLTGMGSDGLTGSRMIRDLGGTVLAQDEASSTVWGMPGAVAGAGLAHKVLPLDSIAPEILRIAGQRLSEPAQILQESLRQVVCG